MTPEGAKRNEFMKDLECYHAKGVVLSPEVDRE